jgi:hypothetical protein
LTGRLFSSGLGTAPSGCPFVGTEYCRYHRFSGFVKLVGR